MKTYAAGCEALIEPEYGHYELMTTYAACWEVLILALVMRNGNLIRLIITCLIDDINLSGWILFFIFRPFLVGKWKLWDTKERQKERQKDLMFILKGEAPIIMDFMISFI